MVNSGLTTYLLSRWKPGDPANNCHVTNNPKIIATFVISALGALCAAPAAAQSLTLVNLPVVYVASPVVQKTHQGIARSIRWRRWWRPATISRRPTFSSRRRARAGPAPAALPVWKAPAFIDRRFRNYNRGVAQYGPFRVLDDRRVALVGETDASTPGYFRAMMRDFPISSSSTWSNAPARATTAPISRSAG